KALALDDAHGESHAIRGLVLVLQRKHEQALAAAQKAIDLAPNAADVVGIAGMVELLSDRPEPARRTAKRALRLCPLPQVLPLNMLGVACRELGLYDEGVAALRQAVAVDPELTTVRFALISILLAAGLPDEARTEAKNLAEVDPRFSLEAYARALPFRDAEVNERVLKNLSEAGLI
ncbi:MAG: tetratricopeptide repeat protein, partial [bacterium]